MLPEWPLVREGREAPGHGAVDQDGLLVTRFPIVPDRHVYRLHGPEGIEAGESRAVPDRRVGESRAAY
ncbi:hypothetical protein ABGB16_18860 [Micromonospora sp. B11E3]|uniref:hypothetical protein n=1 Tax=Micromonospora sp. B11E3 TaxID=3153562 RepID=UPI00325DE803